MPLKRSVKNQNSLGKGKIRIILFLSIVFFIGLILWYQKHGMVSVAPIPKETPKETAQDPLAIPEVPVAVVPELEKKPVTPFPKIPFYLQAPGGVWADPLFQNACEEVSILMVADALSGKTRSVAEQKQEIAAIALWQQKKFGTSVDTNVTDTAQTLTEFLNTKNVSVLEADQETLKQWLSEYKVVIVPTNGQKLKNPHFQQPGPLTHMVVVYGYDEVQDEFMVQDPGTRFGENYRYKADVLVGAMGEYPTGNHVKISGPLPKKAIVVSQ